MLTLSADGGRGMMQALSGPAHVILTSGDEVVAKSAGECFLCEEEGKGKRITFYSGLRKKGSKTELLSATVTVFDRWRDLKMYEIHVCRECQSRLWAQHTKLPPLLCAAGAGVAVFLAVPCALLLPGALGLVVAAALGLVALGAGGAAVWFLLRHLAKKPEREPLERLVVGEAMTHFPDEGHTFLTGDQYVELVKHGVID